MSAFAVSPSACAPPGTTLHLYTSITHDVSIQYCACKLRNHICKCVNGGCAIGGCLK